MVKVWIVYKAYNRAILVNGVFTDYADARANLNNSNDIDLKIRQIELNKEYDKDTLVILS